MLPLWLAQHDKDGSQEGDGCLDADKLWAKPSRDWARTSEQLHVLAASILHVVALEVNQARLRRLHDYALENRKCAMTPY